MPVVVIEKKKKIPVITVRQKTDADGPFVEDEKWGFKITGGSEFGMPITVFNVSTKISIIIFTQLDTNSPKYCFLFT